VWTATGERINDDGVKVIDAVHTNGYPSDFPWWEWQTMPPYIKPSGPPEPDGPHESQAF
jgi:hypothetical protein